MPTRAFTITTDDKPLVLKADGTGEVTVAVSNVTTRAIRGLAKLVPLGATKHEWLKISGEVERNFSRMKRTSLSFGWRRRRARLPGSTHAA